MKQVMVCFECLLASGNTPVGNLTTTHLLYIHSTFGYVILQWHSEISQDQGADRSNSD